MPATETLGLMELDPKVARDINGGDFGATVALASLFCSAMAGGFYFGYNHLGPILNRYI